MPNLFTSGGLGLVSSGLGLKNLVLFTSLKHTTDARRISSFHRLVRVEIFTSVKEGLFSLRCLCSQKLPIASSIIFFTRVVSLKDFEQGKSEILGIWIKTFLNEFLPVEQGQLNEFCR